MKIHKILQNIPFLLENDDLALHLYSMILRKAIQTQHVFPFMTLQSCI